MLPPVIEIYVVWHPDDADGRGVADKFVDHFHGALFSGLIGGAIEVYVRSVGWRSPNDAPRPMPLPDLPPPNGVAQAELTVIVPVLGPAMADAVQSGEGPWYEYVANIAAARQAHARRVAVLPLSIDPAAIDGTVLAGLIGRWQLIAAPGAAQQDEPASELRCRDLAQAIAQFAETRDGRLKVFISHTKRALRGDEPDVFGLIDQVRAIIANTRLAEFFDAHDLEPGQDWDAALRRNAGSSALFVLRTDLYSSREWCQREVLIAKQMGMPVVVLDALSHGEERGSFLMDHVPRVRAHEDASGWREEDIRRGLNLLVDECLKRVLWRRQRALAVGYPCLNVAWWAPHAPEPTTFAGWFHKEGRLAMQVAGPGPLLILHPDPPLGADEKQVLQLMAEMAGIDRELDILTPRGLAARGA